LPQQQTHSKTYLKTNIPRSIPIPFVLPVPDLYRSICLVF